MNFYEFIMMFFYVSFCTGIISLGCHYAEKLERGSKRKLELVMTNLENPLDK